MAIPNLDPHAGKGEWADGDMTPNPNVDMGMDPAVMGQLQADLMGEQRRAAALEMSIRSWGDADPDALSIIHRAEKFHDWIVDGTATDASGDPGGDPM